MKDNCQTKPNYQEGSLINTDDIFLKKDYCLQLPVLPNLNIYSQTCLTDVLERIDYFFGKSTNTLSYSTVVLPFLKSTKTVNNLKDFSEAVDEKLLFVNTKLNQLTGDLTNYNTSLTSKNLILDSINRPEILDTSNIGITVYDNIKTILQKIVNNLKSFDFQETALSSTDSNSLRFVLTGVKNHSITGNVKISSSLNNLLSLKSDGLFVEFPDFSIPPLTLSGNTLSLGASSVQIPVTGLQTLSLAGNILSLTGTNDNILLPSFQETAISVNSSTTITLTSNGTSGHSISAAAKISPSVGNQLIDRDGLYVKIGAAQILEEIASDANLYNNSFLDLVNTGVAVKSYKWAVANTSGIARSIEYVNAGGVITTLSVPINTTAYAIGYRINTFDPGLQIIFLGQQ